MSAISEESDERKPSQILVWILLFFGLVLGDLLGCLGIQAFIDHVLHIDNETVAPFISHAALGSLAYVLLARYRAGWNQSANYVTFAAIWAVTAPVAWLFSFLSNFQYRFTLF